MPEDGQRLHYKCLGIGAGPANLSLASLLHDRSDVPNLFLDQKPAFSWHDGQLFPDAGLQVSMLKDLVTLADPTNPFSFLAYLHAQGRMYHYINARFDSVPRREFRNYLEWVSRRNPAVVFGEAVRLVEFDGHFVVHTDRRTITADNLSVGIGSQPWTPPIAAELPATGQFHVCNFLQRAPELVGRSVLLVGGGQSGAEAFLNIASLPVDQRPARLTWVSRRRSFFPIDDSPFTNEFYMPSYSDHFYRQDPASRSAFNLDQVLSSDGISEATLRQIYQRLYVQRFIDGEHDWLALSPNQTVVDVTPLAAGGWGIGLADSAGRGEIWRTDVDVIVWATGYRPTPAEFLAPLRHRLQRDGGEFSIDESFAIRWDGPPDRNIFVHNAAEQQRGLADRNLSLVAWRSQRIVDRLVGAEEGTSPHGTFIDWSPGSRVAPAAGAYQPGGAANRPTGVAGSDPSPDGAAMSSAGGARW